MTDPLPAREYPRLPGMVPTWTVGDIIIRGYYPQDDPFLMELERLSPRGEPRPFVHFRRRFIDRAMLFEEPYIFIAEKDGVPVAVTSIAIKNTVIGGEAVRICYSFDTRVHPYYRRQGIANMLQEAKLHFLQTKGVHGIYALVVASNIASINMLQKVGFHKVRMILYLTYPPYPIIIPPPEEPLLYETPVSQDAIQWAFGQRDLFLPDVADTLVDFHFQRLCLSSGMGISVFDQSLVYQQISADEPWPSEAEILKRGRVWRIFDEVGIHYPDELRAVFDTIRDLAVTSNVLKLTWIVDRADPVPGFVFEEASAQKDYWLLFQSLQMGFEPQWTNAPIYIDARDL